MVGAGTTSLKPFSNSKREVVEKYILRASADVDSKDLHGLVIILYNIRSELYNCQVGEC